MLTKKYLDSLTYEIIGSAIEVHKIMEGFTAHPIITMSLCG